MTGLRLEILSSDSIVAFASQPGNQWEGRELSSSVATFYALLLKQVFKNARGRCWSIGQLSSSVADTENRGQFQNPTRIINGSYYSLVS